jgi:hypothetical protein
MKLQKITIFCRELFQTLFSILKIILISKWFVSFKKYYVEEKECVILGNGPCLVKDLEKNFDFIISRKKFVVNTLAFSKQYEELKPDYYVLTAPEFWLKNTIKFHIDQRTRLIKTIFEKTSWQMKLLVPFAAKNTELLNFLITNKNITPVFINLTPIEGNTYLINRLFKANLGTPRPHNVLIPTIFLAMNFRFKKIFIFGADHSWHEEIKVDESNKVTVNHEHFFENKEVRMPMYKLDGQVYFIHDVFNKLQYAFKGYFILRNYAKYLNVKIYNASSKSYIDAFERISVS